MPLIRTVPAARALLASLAVLGFAAVAAAADPYPMTPLPSETLKHPVHLKCGLVIREWRGDSTPSAAGVAYLDRLCADGVRRFRPFLAARGIVVPPEAVAAFEWNESLIPDGYCSRCLNDRPGRFTSRFVSGDVWGYTHLRSRYSYLISDLRAPIFPKVFTHELFHALSMYTGVFAAHGGSDWDKVEADEQLAVEFASPPR